MASAQRLHLLQYRNRRVETWSKQFLQAVWEISFATWEHRNHELHGDSLTPTEAALLDSLRQKIREEFAKGDTTLLSHDKWLVRQDSKDWAVNQSLPKTKRWLETVTLSRKAYAAKQTKINNELTRQQRGMSQWLVTAAPTGA